jgi:vanillate O-demethylase ferredoxin subunit
MLDLRADQEGDPPLDLRAIVATLPAGAHVYACGPAGLLDAFEAATAALPPERVHLERFANVRAAASDGGFTVVLARSGQRVPVQPGQTVLDAVRAAGVEPMYSCREGVCGTCETRVLRGTPDHRDLVLGDAEKAAGDRMMICCSGALTPELELDL